MKQALGPVFQAFELDPSGSAPLYQQLYVLLRDALVAGALPAGSRLPSTRSLATDLSLSRNTVSAAFDQLVDEGLVESRVGDGSYVSPTLAEECFPDRRSLDAPHSVGDEQAASEQPLGPRGVGSSRALSRRGQGIAGSVVGRDPLRPRAFAVGVPALDAFPLATWQRTSARRARNLVRDDLGHGPAGGDRRLRELIARYLATARGVRCAAEQVLILPSAQLGLDLASRLLLDPGDAAWIEDPGYLGARSALLAAGARVVPVPVDEDGLAVRVGRSRAPGARLAYVTPSHQFPLGESMTLRRRLQLLAWAEEAGAWILEDDYDSEYRYAGAAAQAMQGLDRTGRVLYIGTFSKVLFPALRLGYMVVPEDLIESFEVALFLIAGHVSRSAQATLADFIEAGHFVGHLRRMRSLYRERRDVLLHELTRRFGGLFHRFASDAGMHVSVGLNPRNAPAGDVGPAVDQAIARRAAVRGLDLAPLSRYFLGPDPEQGFAFGYTHVPADEIVQACGTLESVLMGEGLIA